MAAAAGPAAMVSAALLGGCLGDVAGDGEGAGSGERLGAAVLDWDAPTTSADGTCLTDLAGFEVHYALSPRSDANIEFVELAGLESEDTGRAGTCGTIVRYRYRVDGLRLASWYFTVAAVDAAGNISGPSNQVVYTIE